MRFSISVAGNRYKNVEQNVFTEPGENFIYCQIATNTIYFNILENVLISVTSHFRAVLCVRSHPEVYRSSEHFQCHFYNEENHKLSKADTVVFVFMVFDYFLLRLCAFC